MARGEPIWQTSSTGPTSIPSSSDAVATRARRSPARSRCSTSRRRAAERLPWWAATCRAASTGSRASRSGSSVAVLGRAESFGQEVGDPLGHLARVDEHQGRAVLEDVGGDAVEHVPELGAARHRLELGRRQLDGHVEVALVAAVDHRGRRPGRIGARQQPGHHLEGPLRRRQPDALEAAAVLRHQRGQALEGEGEVGAALVAGQGVHLVDDHRVHAAEHRARGGGGEEQVEGLGGGDEQVGWVPAHGRPLGGRGVAGADGDAKGGGCQPEAFGLPLDAGQWHLQVLVDVGGQGSEGGDVDHTRPGLLGGRPAGRLGSVGGIDGHEEAGQGLAGARR